MVLNAKFCEHLTYPCLIVDALRVGRCDGGMETFKLLQIANGDHKTFEND